MALLSLLSSLLHGCWTTIIIGTLHSYLLEFCPVLRLSGIWYIRSISHGILPWSWYIKLQTLAVEHLVEVEPRWSLIKSNVFSREGFVVICSDFLVPFSTCVFEVVLYFILNPEYLLRLMHHGVVENRRVILVTLLELAWVEYPDVRVWFLEMIEPISSRHEDAVYLRALLLVSSVCPCGSLWLPFYSQSQLCTNQSLHLCFLVLTRIWSKLWLHPWFKESVSIATEWPKSDSLFLLEASIIFVHVVSLNLEGAMLGIVDIDVCSWSRLLTLNFLIAWSGLTAVKCCMNSLFLNDLVLDIIFLLFVIILAWSRILMESLLGVRSFTLITPEVSSLSLRKEALRLLSN